MKKNYVTLEDVCIKGSSNIAQKDLENNEGKYPIYGASGFIKNVDFYVQEKPYIAVVKDGAGIGRTMMLPAYSSVIGTMQYLLPKDNIDISYLYYAVTAMNLAKYYTGATIPHIYFKDYRKEKLPLVDKLEQKKIVEVLSKIDALRSCHERQLYDFEVLVKSRFIEMFGDPVTNPNQFPKVALSELADIKIGPFGSLLHKEDYIENGHPIVNPSHIIEGKIAIDTSLTISNKKYMELGSYQLHVGDVVLGRRGEMGRCAVVLKNGLLCGTGSMIIRTKGEVTADFIQKIISFPTFRKSIENMSVGQTMPNLNVPIVSNFFVIKPPIEVQKEYYAFIDKIVKSKFTNYKSLLLLIIKKIWYNNYM